MYTDPDGHMWKWLENIGNAIKSGAQATANATKGAAKWTNENVAKPAQKKVDKTVNAVKDVKTAVGTTADIVNKTYYKNKVSSESAKFNIAVGTFNMAVDNATAIVESANHPIETGKSLAKVAGALDTSRIYNPDRIELALAIQKKATNEWEEFKEADSNKKIQKATAAVEDVLMIAVPIKGTGVLKGLEEVNVEAKVAKEASVIGKELEGTGVTANKIPWGSWNDYKKVTVDGQEYAKVGNRLYSRHAVDRMQPSGNKYGNSITQAGGDYGRSVAPQYVEDVISSVKPIAQENGNLKYVGGSLEVITNPQGNVVTIMTK